MYTDDCAVVLLQLCDDQVQRVQAHALAALTNLFESIDNKLILKHTEKLLVKCFSLLSNKCSLVKENSVSTIAAVAEASKKEFHKYYQQCVPVLFEMYETHKDKCYKQLRGQIIECITLIGFGVEKSVFLQDFHKIVSILVELQNSKLDEKDPSMAYIISGWQRLSLKYNEQLLPYLNNVIPKLFEILKELVNRAEKEQKDNQNSEQINTYVEDNVQISLEMIQVFLDRFQEHYYNYVIQTIQLITPLCTYQQSAEIRKQACNLIPSLIKCVKQSKQPIDVLLNLFVDNFLAILKHAQEPEQITNIIDALSECFKLLEGPFLNPEILQKLHQYILDLLKKADTLIKQYQKDENDEDNVEEDIQNINDDIKELESLYIDTVFLIGYIVKSHKLACLQFVNDLYVNIVPQLLQDNASKVMIRCGMYIIIDIVEHIGYENSHQTWNWLLEQLIKNSSHKYFLIRQTAIYGLGIFAQKTPGDAYKEYSNLILQSLFSSYSVQKDNESDKSYGKCQDNVIAAIGKIIEAQSGNIDLRVVLDYWIQQLPLKFDKQESIYQTNLLLRIALEKPDILFAKTVNYDNVVFIYAKIIQTKFCNDEISGKIKQSLKILQNVPYIQQNWTRIQNELNDIQKNNLKALMNGN
eukprot:TRINITY_DN14435_c0_g1_i1.p1 TRINITY_DN14435_c0_g1~~TRINITY_DN14435_c0_g1_i1.p1  ORF type:complete len:639 (-),score=83.41 TRINITY_DN14435_c0_g1_i1:40-1956(-)